MTYGSVCSGIEAASVAWESLGWKPAWFSEIEPFPNAVLAHHYPEVPNLGDFTQIGHGRPTVAAAIDLLVGGTPCQDFSIAGLRAGLAGDRGRLTVEFVKLLERLHPRWFVWENVPGVLSADSGAAFGIFLDALAKLGYGFAYRVLDAQHFGVPQRRRRVFVVGHLGDWRRAAAVLFERESMSGNPAPSRQARQVAPTIPSRSTAGGGLGSDFDCDGGLVTAGTVRSHRRNNSNPVTEAKELVVAFTCKDAGGDLSEDVAPTLRSMHHAEGGQPNGGGQVAIIPGVRRLTPRECERLQGFPDDWTAVPYRGKPAADGPRYRALGNSMAVPCMKWIGQRIDLVDSQVRSKHD